MEAAASSITLVHGVTSRKNVIFTFTVVRTCTASQWNLMSPY